MTGSLPALEGSVTNPFREGQLVQIAGRSGLFLVEMPLETITWVRSVVSNGTHHQPGRVDTFEWTYRLRAADVGSERVAA